MKDSDWVAALILAGFALIGLLLHIRGLERRLDEQIRAHFEQWQRANRYKDRAHVLLLQARHCRRVMRLAKAGNPALELAIEYAQEQRERALQAEARARRVDEELAQAFRCPN